MDKNRPLADRTIEEIDALLIADGYPAQCVTWVCDQHYRHCVLISTEHVHHLCIWCAIERGEFDG